MAEFNWTTIKEYEDIRFEFLEGIAKITINRPQVYNAFRPETNIEMIDAMNICRERGDIGRGGFLPVKVIRLFVQVAIKM